MRSTHKAALDRQAHALELVLEHHRGAEVLAASGGDAEHALRVIEELKHRAPSSNVIRLPRDPILDFSEVYDRELDEPAPARARGLDWLVTIGLGLVAWVVLAAIAFGLYELVERLR